MSRFLVIALLLCVLKDRTRVAMAWEDEDFFSYCPPSRCSEHGPEIRFPFQLESSNTSSLCGAPCMKLAWSGEDAILVDSALAAYKVTAIDYRRGTMTITPPVNASFCHLIDKLNSASVPHLHDLSVWTPRDPCYIFYHGLAAIVCCPRKFTPSGSAVNDIVGPISCFSNATHFSYMADAFADLSVLPLDCKLVSNGTIPMPDIMLVSSDDYRAYFKNKAEIIINVAEMTVYWLAYGIGVSYNCTQCEGHGRRCAFSSQMNQTFCMHHGIRYEEDPSKRGKKP